MPTPALPALKRAALLALLCLGLSGCVGISSNINNNLAAAPSTGKHAPRVPMAFIIHPPPEGGADSRVEQVPQRESLAWAAALADYATPRHIYIATTTNPNNMSPELREFCRSHPVVDIYNQEDQSREGIEFLTSLVALPLDFASYGMLPIPVTEPYTARFRLTLPGDRPYTPATADASAPAIKQEYAYLRRETLTPLLFLPLGDMFRIFFVPPCSGCGGGEVSADDTSKWREREKRQLIARFMREAQPTLEAYANQAEHGGAGAQP